MEEVGLTDADFRDIPALFYETYTNEHVAYFPSMQNLLVVNDLLFIPDPEGPEVDGADVWRQAAQDVADDLGLTAHFVDVYRSYHTLKGGIHCGVNVERAGLTNAWWSEAEDTE